MRERIYSMSVSKKRSCSHTLQNEMNSYQWRSKNGKINKEGTWHESWPAGGELFRAC